MTGRRPWAAAAIAAAVLAFSFSAAGCQTDEYAPESHPKTYEFNGKADSGFVGTWSTTDGNSTMLLNKDGTMKITTVEHSVKGRTVDVVAGEWRANAGSLLFRYNSGSQKSVVLKYMDSLAGNKLVLQQPGLKIKTTYHRK